MKLKSFVFGLFLLIFILPNLAHALSAEKAYLFVDPKEDLRARFELISHSKQAMISVFEMSEDQIGLAEIAALVESAHEGGRPRLLLDALGHKLSKDMIAYMVEQKVEVRLFRDLEAGPVLSNGSAEALQRMHDKVITDGNFWVLTGGRNSREPYFGLDPKLCNFIDYDILIAGLPESLVAQSALQYQNSLWSSPMVQTPKLRKLTPKRRQQIEAKLSQTIQSLRETGFIENSPTNWWARLAPVEAEFIHDKVSPAGHTSGAEKALIGLLKQARSEVLIDAQYLLLTPDISSAMGEAVKKGVQIEIITNGHSAYEIGSDHLVREAFELSKPNLRKLGITVREYQGPGKIHSKEVVVDRRSCLIWSFNLDPRSRFINYESGAQVESPTLCGELAAHMRQHMDQALVTIDHGRQMVPDRKIPSTDRALIAAIYNEL
jgi:putative cardiolipin synthase